MPPCLNFTLYSDTNFLRNCWRNDVRSLTKLCLEFAGSHYSIEIVHVPEDRQRAFHAGITSTPTVLLELPDGRQQNLGNLAKTREYLQKMTSPAAEPGILIPAQLQPSGLARFSFHLPSDSGLTA